MLAYLFVMLAVAVRFMPHPWTFTPVTGALLFFGAYRPRRELWLPVVLLAVSDLALNKFVYAYPFTVDQLVPFAWYAGVLWLGAKIPSRKIFPALGAALASSVSFYLVTNFTAWAWLDMYPKTLAGLIMSYVAALPFFRHALEGDLLFTTAMFAIPLALRGLENGLGGGRNHTEAA